MISRASVFWRRAVLGLAVAALVGVGACGPGGGLSRTHPATGRVVFKGGNVRQLEGAMVEFESVTSPEIAAQGEVQADGTFAISSTSKDGRYTAEGAVPGEHRVRVVPPNPREDETRRLIDRKFQQFDTSKIRVQIPSDQEIVIEVHRPPR